MSSGLMEGLGKTRIGPSPCYRLSVSRKWQHMLKDVTTLALREVLSENETISTPEIFGLNCAVV